MLDVADWVQVGRYAAGLDPETPASHPISPASGRLDRSGVASIASVGRSIGIGACSIQREEAGDTHVWLDGDGTECALSFSVAYDSDHLSFLSAAPLGVATGAVFLPNITTSNQVGFALQMPEGMSFAAGSNAILNLNFAAAPDAHSATVTVGFVDTPVPRGMSDTAGSTLAADWYAGKITVTAPVVTPTLTPPTGVVASAVSRSQINLTWSDVAAEDGYGILRQNGGAGPWQVVATLSSSTTAYSDSGLDSGMLYLYRVSASNSAGTVYSGIATGRTWNAIERWRVDNFGTIQSTGEGADDADWDGDGEKNLMEYAVGRSPVWYDSNSVYKVAIEELVGSNRFVTVRYRVPNPAPDDVTVAVEVATNLMDGVWQQTLVPVERVESNGMDIIRLRTAEPAGVMKEGFFRLRAW